MPTEMSFKETMDNFIGVLANKTMKYCMQNNYKFSIEPYLTRNTYEITISANSTEEYESLYRYFYMHNLEDVLGLEKLIESPIERIKKIQEPKEEVMNESAEV